MASRIIGRGAAGIVAVLAVASLHVAALAAPTPVTGGHTFNQGVSGPGLGRQPESARAQNEFAHSRVMNVQPCGYGQPGLIDTNGDLMMSAAAPSPYNTVGAMYAGGGPTLLSFFGYGNASLSSWWMSPAGQIAAQMGLSPLASQCGSFANFVPEGW